MRRLGLTVAALLLCLPMVGEGQSIQYRSAGGGSFNPQDFYIVDEFLGGTTGAGSIGQLGWEGGGTVSYATYSVFADRPGLISYTPGATARNGIKVPAGFALRYANINTTILWVAVSTGANVPDFRAGWVSSIQTAVPADDAAFFEHEAADTNWFAVTRDAGNETRIDTNVAFAADTFVKLKIEHPSTNVWNFYINDALVASKSSGYIPTETYGCHFQVQMETYGTAVVSYVDLFWASFRSSR